MTRAGILSQEEPPLPQKLSSRNGGGNSLLLYAINYAKLSRVLGALDLHLQTLQLLSAHMKLLLDAPEHLWRLIERKKFFQAAWLFLLARVVHRALVREDEQDEGSWSRQGVDVLVRMLNPLTTEDSSDKLLTEPISLDSTAVGRNLPVPLPNCPQGNVIAP